MKKFKSLIAFLGAVTVALFGAILITACVGRANASAAEKKTTVAYAAADSGYTQTIYWYTDADWTILHISATPYDEDSLEYGCGYNQFSGTLNFEEDGSGSWLELRDRYYNNDTVKTVQFDSVVKPKYLNFWFERFREITTFVNLSNLDTSGALEAKYTFSECYALKTLDLSSFNTSNITSFYAMFHYCQSLTTLNLSGWDTAKVRNAEYMFYACNELTALDMSSFDFGYANAFTEMFGKVDDPATQLNALTEIKISESMSVKLKTGAIDSFVYVGKYTRWLNPDGELIGSSAEMDIAGTYTCTYTPRIWWTISERGTLRLYSTPQADFEVFNANDIYYYDDFCPPWYYYDYDSIVGVSVNGEIRPASMRYWFHRLPLKNLSLTGLNTEYTSDMSYTFAWLDLAAIDFKSAPNFVTGNVIEMVGTFRDSSYTGLDLTTFDTKSVTDMSEMFYNCPNLTTLDLSAFDTAKQPLCDETFSLLPMLGEIKISESLAEMFAIGEINSFSYINSNAYWLNGDGDKIKSSQEMSAAGTYIRPYSPKIYWRVTNNDTRLTIRGDFATGYESFYGTDNTVPWWDYRGGISSVNISTEVKPAFTASWFEGFTSLTAVENIGNLNTTYTTDMTSMFNGCESLKAIDLSDFKTQDVVSMAYMFYDCVSLEKLDLSNFDVRLCRNFEGMLDALYAMGEMSISESLAPKFAVSEVVFDHITPTQLWTTEAEDRTITTSEDFNEAGTYKSGYTPVIYWLYKPTTQKLYISAEPFNSSLQTNAAYDSFHGTLDAYYYRVNYWAYDANGKYVHYDYFRTNVPWWEYRLEITEVEFSTPVYVANTSYWFFECVSLSKITNIGNLKGKYATSFRDMFNGAAALQSLDLSALDVSRGLTFSNMLTGLESLSELKLSQSVADKMDVTDFDMISADFPWYYNEYHPDNMVTAAYLMSMAGVYINPVTPTIYWKFVETTGKLTLSAVSQVTTSGDYGSISGLSADVPWLNYARGITSVEIDGIIKPVSTAWWFAGLTELKTIDLKGLVTGNVTDMSYMFVDCTSLTSITLPDTFTTSSVVSMAHMFENCYVLGEIDLDSFDTSSVVDMSCMFANCQEFKELDVSKFDTSNVEDISAFIYGCISLKSIDLSQLDLSVCVNFADMLGALDSLEAITIGETFSELFCDGRVDSFANPNESAFWLSPAKRKIVGYWEMVEIGTYVNPYSAKIYWRISGGNLIISDTGTNNQYIPGYSYETPWRDDKYYSSVTAVEIDGIVKPASTGSWFYEADRLTAVRGLSNLDTAYTTNMEAMFYGCSALTQLNVTTLKTANVQSTAYMFYNCFSLTELNVTGFDTANVQSMAYMFYNCAKLKTLDLSGFEVSYCQNFEGTLDALEAITELTISTSVSAKLVSGTLCFWNPNGTAFWLAPSGKRVEHFSYMTEAGTYTSPYTPFIYWSLKNGQLRITDNDISNNRIAGTSTEVPWIDNAVRIKSVSIEGSVTPASTAGWFAECTELKTIDLTGLNTSYVSSMAYMFYNCNSLQALDMSKWEVSNCNDFGYAFDGLNALGEVKISISVSDCLLDYNIPSFPYPTPDAYWISPSGKHITSQEDMREVGKYVSSYTPVIYYNIAGLTLNISSEQLSNSQFFYSYTGEVPWYDDAKDLVTTVNVQGDVRPVYTNDWFNSFTQLKTANLSGLDTRYTVETVNMFYGCEKLESLDLSNINTENVRNFSGMFQGCVSLGALDLSTFDLTSSRSSEAMLSGLTALSSLTISKSVAESMRRVGFDVVTISTPWYFYDDGPEVLLTDARQMTRAGKYVNPITAAIYWQFSNAKLTISDKPFTSGNYEKFAVTQAFDWRYNRAPWAEEYETRITSVEISGSVAPAYTAWWFYNLQNVKSINLTGLNTAYVTDMTGMFSCCISLTDLRFGNTFDTSQVQSMQEMFAECISLTSLDLSFFETPSLTNMAYMFGVDNREWQSSLSELDISNFNVSRCDNMEDAFSGLTSIRTFKISLSVAVKLVATAAAFDYPTEAAYWLSPSGKKITSYTQMREAGTYVCPYTPRIYWKIANNKLTISDVSLGSGSHSFGTLVAQDNDEFWREDNFIGQTYRLKEVVITGNVSPTNTIEWFCDLTELTSIDLSGLDTSYTTDMSGMFYNCNVLETLDMHKMNVAGCNYFDGMLGEMPSLKVIILSDTLATRFRDGTIEFANVTTASPWYTHEGVKVTTSQAMRYGTMYINPYTTSIYWKMSNRTLYISSTSYGTAGMSFNSTGRMDEEDYWAEIRGEVQTVTFESEIKPANTRYWFSAFTELKTINNLKYLNMTYATDMEGMFEYCTSLTSLDLSMLNTSNVVNMTNLFRYSEAIATLDISNFDMTNTRYTDYMLSYMTALSEISISGSVAGKMANLGFTSIETAPWYYEDGTKIVEAAKIRKAGTYTSSYTPIIYWDYYGGVLTLSNTEQTHRTDHYGSFAVGEVFREIYWYRYGTNSWGWYDTANHWDNGSSSGSTYVDRNPWAAVREDTTTVKFVGRVAPVNMCGWFTLFTNLTTVDFSGFSSANVIDMRAMFDGCTSLDSLDMSGWDVSSVMYYSYPYSTQYGSSYATYNGFDWVFSGLDSLSTVTLSSSLAEKFGAGYIELANVNPETPWYFEDGTKITTPARMKWQGRYASSYTPIIYHKLSGSKLIISSSHIDAGEGQFSGADWFGAGEVPWYGKNYTSVEIRGTVRPLHTDWWFQEFKGTSLNLTGLDTFYTQSMYGMFVSATKLTNLRLDDNFTTANCTEMGEMFNDCKLLASLDVTKFDTSKVKGFYGMFAGMYSLTALDLSSFDMSSAEDVRYMLSLDGSNAAGNPVASKLRNINLSLSVANLIVDTYFSLPSEEYPWRRDGGRQITDVSQMTAAGKYYYDGMVVFKNGDTVLQIVELKSGQTLAYTGATPTKAPTADTYYLNFLGWTRVNGSSAVVDLSTITQSTTLFASFEYVTVVAPETPVTYDGTPHAASLINGSSQPDSAFTIKYSYSQTQDGEYVEEASAVRAGWHKAQLTFGSDSVGVAFGIGKKEVKITGGVVAADKQYDGTTNASLDCTGAVISGKFDSDELFVQSATGKFTDANAHNNLTVNISDWVLGGSAKDNYSVAASGNATATANITKKVVGVNIEVQQTMIVGHVTAAVAQVTDCDGLVAPVVTLTYTSDKGYNSTKLPDTPANYTVTASIANTNFDLQGTDTATFEIISPYNMITSVKFEQNEYYYGDIVRRPTVTATHGEGTEIITYYKDETRVQPVAVSDSTVLPAGTYYVYVRIPANYDYAEATTTVKLIIKAKQVTINFVAGGGTYGQSITYPVVQVISATAETLPTATVAYKDKEGNTLTSRPVNAGKYTAIAVISDPNYEIIGDNEIEFVIDTASIEGATLSSVADQTFTGDALTPALTVTLNGTKLTLNRDFELVYENNVNVTFDESGAVIAGAKIAVKGKGNYGGEITVSFKITPAALTDGMVTVEDTVFTGVQITPTIGVRLNGKLLTVGTDYSVACGENIHVVYDSAKNVINGGTVTITGLGNVTGSVTKSFKIKPADLSTVTIGEIGDQEYTGSAIEPELDIRLGEYVLDPSEYNVTYSGNINKGTATITLSGKNDVVGSKRINFLIVPREVRIVITALGGTVNNVKPATAKVYDRNDEEVDVEVKFTYTDSNGKTQENVPNVIGSYVVTASISNANYSVTGGTTANFEISANGNSISELVLDDWTFGEPNEPSVVAESGDEVPVIYTYYNYEDTQMQYPLTDKPVNAGTYWVKAEILSSENYGYARASKGFTIYPATLTADMVTVEDAPFTGSAIEPTIIITYLGETYGEECYTVDSLGENIKVSSGGSVTITAKGNFTGSVTKTFAITAVTLTEDMFVISKQPYTGSQIIPEISFVFNGETPVGENYTVTGYGENINVADDGYVDVTGKGNFTGSVRVEFEIVPRQVYAVITAVDGAAGSVSQPTVKIYDLKDKQLQVEYTLKYFNSENEELDGVPQIAGTFTVKLTLNDENYELTEEATATLNVSAESNELTVTLEDWIYGSPNEPEITIKFGADSAVVNYYSEEDRTMQNPLEGKPVNAGSYRIKVVVPSTEQYAEAQAVVKFKIKPKTVTVSGISVDDKEYDGTTNVQLNLDNVTLDGVLEGDELTVAADAAYNGADAGQHVVNVTNIKLVGDAAGNYALTETSLQLSSEITRKQVKVTITSLGGAADEEEIVGATADVYDMNNAPLSGVEVTLTYTDSTGAVVDGVPQIKGTYTVTATIEDENYLLTGDDNTATFIVSDMRNSITSLVLEDWEYGSPNQPETEALQGEDTVTYNYFSLNDDGTVSADLGATQPVNAGSYRVVATISATDDYAGATAQLDFNITKKQVSVSGITAQDKPFDGTAAATLGYDDVEFTGLLEEDEGKLTVTAVGTFDGINAGLHTVNVTEITLVGEAAGNYRLSSTEAQIEGVNVTSVTLVGSIAADDGVIGTPLPAPVVTVTDTEGNAVTIEYTLTYAVKNGDELDEAPAEAGTYVVTLSIEDTNFVLTGELTAEFIIYASANTATITIESWEYGSPEEPEISADFGEDTAVITYFEVDGDGNETALTAKPENVGKYIVKLEIAKTADYTSASASAEFEITPKQLYATIEMQSGLAGETLSAATVTITDGDGNEYEIEFAVVYVDGDGNESEDVPESVGAYSVKVTVSDDNCKLNDGTFAFVISGNSNQITLLEQSDWVYGSYAAPVIEALSGADTAVYTYYKVVAGDGETLVKLDGVPEDVGNYKVEAVIPATVEYTSVSAITDFAITPKDITVILTAVNGVVNTEAASATAQVVGYVGETAPEVTIVYVDTDSNVYDQLPDTAGVYTATASITDKNYNLTGEVTCTVIISASANSVTVTMSGWEYGSPEELEITADFGEDTAVVTYFAVDEDGNQTALSAKPENVGNYVVKVTIPATVEYAGVTDSVEFEITHKSVLVEIDAESNFLGLVEPATAQITDLDGEPLEVEFVITYVAEDGTEYEALPEVPGKFTVTVTIPNENYKIIGKNTQRLTIMLMGGLEKNSLVLIVGDVTYGETIEPEIEALFGAETVVYKYFLAEDTERLNPLESVPVNVGNYVLVATIRESIDDGYEGATDSVEFSILAKEVTAVITIPELITVPNGSAALAEGVPAEVTVEGLFEGDGQYITVTYVSTDGNGYEDTVPPVEIGKYKVVVTVNSDNYALDRAGATAQFTIAKGAEDPEGGGSIELPDDREFDFAITEVDTDKKYDLKGLSVGRKAQLWEIIDGVTSTTEYTGSLEATLTFRVPDEISKVINVNGIDLENVKTNLRVYLVNEEGELGDEIDFTPFIKKTSSDSKGELMVKINYNGNFPVEAVFNAPNYSAPSKKAGMAWWLWLIIALAVLLIVAIIVMIIVIKKKKGAAAVGAGYDDAELKAQLAAQSDKLDALMQQSGAKDSGLTDEQMRNYFSDEELWAIVQRGELSEEDYYRIVGGGSED